MFETTATNESTIAATAERGGRAQSQASKTAVSGSKTSCSAGRKTAASKGAAINVSGPINATLLAMVRYTLLFDVTSATAAVEF